jgi:hypothetical protein
MRPENPAYINLQARLEQTNSELRATQVRQDELRDKMADYEARLINAPQIEQEYRPMVRDYEHAVRNYDEIRTKLTQAEIAKQLEEKQRGERFSVIKPASLPDRSKSPNRPAILLIGLVLAMMSGIGYASLAEVMDPVRARRSGHHGYHGRAPSIRSVHQQPGGLLRRRNARVATVAIAAIGLLGLVLIAQSFWGSSDASRLHGVLTFNQRILD